MMSKYKELKLEYDNLRRENRQLSLRLEASDRRIDALSNRFLDQMEELENKMHAETSEQVRSLRNVYEISFQILEGRLRDYMDRDTEVAEANIQRNTQEIRRVSLRQQTLEERINGLNQPHHDECGSSGTLKITPKNPIYEGKTSPVKFLEELKDFWTAVRPSRGQAAFIISSCLQGTPRDWWDLVKEEDDDLPQFVQKFKRRYWGEETQHSVKTKLGFGSYQGGRDGSMTAYAIKIFREARGLTPAPAVREIISKLARHFNEEIRCTILGRPINTLEDLLELLKRFDNTGPLNVHRNDNFHPRDNWRNNISASQQPYTRFTGERPNQNRRYQETQHRTVKDESWRRPAKAQETTQNNVRTIDVVTYEDEAPDHKAEQPEN